MDGPPIGRDPPTYPGCQGRVPPNGYDQKDTSASSRSLGYSPRLANFSESPTQGSRPMELASSPRAGRSGDGGVTVGMRRNGIVEAVAPAPMGDATRRQPPNLRARRSRHPCQPRAWPFRSALSRKRSWIKTTSVPPSLAWNSRVTWVSQVPAPWGSQAQVKLKVRGASTRQYCPEANR